jgi:hypothetical protein
MLGRWVSRAEDCCRFHTAQDSIPVRIALGYNKNH